MTASLSRPETQDKFYDLLIVGGGLGGLSLANYLGKNLKTALFEKNKYPFHRVCGEYISNESLPFLLSLGVNPFEHGAKELKKLKISSVTGFEINANLDLGGFGISRYTLDFQLAQEATRIGVDVYDSTKIVSIKRNPDDSWIIKSSSGEEFIGKKLVLSHGKRSNLDSTLQRPFFKLRSPYVGIKYHIKTELPNDLIALHNFGGGYAGVSRIENQAFCFCYLVHREVLRKSGSIKAMEKEVLERNPYLKKIYSESEFLWDKPESINEISFRTKGPFENGIFYLGDSAGMVVPLFGNGMSMAIRAAKILGDTLFNNSDLSSQGKEYSKKWYEAFNFRFKLGRALQAGFGKKWTTELLLKSAGSIPPIKNSLIKLSHGKPF